MAREIRGDTWQLADNTEEVLKGMGLMRDITKRRATYRWERPATGPTLFSLLAGRKIFRKNPGDGASPGDVGGKIPVY